MRPLEQWRLALLKAANLIETVGWCQGAFTRQGAVCAYAAIAKVARNDVSSTAADRLKDYINAPIAVWNDDPIRTKKQVIEAMRGCALGLGASRDGGQI